MKIAYLVLIGLLVFLAGSSGLTKIMLMDQEVEFFGKFGVAGPLIIGFGIVQLIGAVLLIFTRTRITGAVLIAITFVMSAYMLIVEGNWPFTIATLLALVLLGSVISKTRREASR